MVPIEVWRSQGTGDSSGPACSDFDAAAIPNYDSAFGHILHINCIGMAVVEQWTLQQYLISEYHAAKSKA
jgi:hypothetical protein